MSGEGLLDALLRAPSGSIVDHKGEISLAEILARAARVASALRGRRIAVLAAPTREFVISVLGVMWSGATAVVLSPLHTPIEREAACRRAGVDYVMTTPWELSGTPPLPDPSSDALILFTSGTTAAPKGARLTHRNLLAHARVLHDAWRWSRDDHLIHALPLHHLHGLGTALFTALAAGARVELLPRFDARAVLAAIREQSVWMAVPTTIARVLDAPGAQQLRALRLTTNGSAGLPRVLSDRFEAIAGQRPLERFGMTETGVVTTQPLDGPREPGNCGRPVSGMEVRIVDDEIQVRGEGVFAGYVGQEPELDDGWFRTGDGGALDERGELFVTGRLSVDVLKCGGYKLSALEIEAAIREHPAVADVAVIGVPDVEWGDRTVAIVVPRDALDVDALRTFLRERLAPYKIPKAFELRRELPRNSIGKVIKPVLIDELSRSTAV